jgi:DNA-binding NarL/FixJ family response regulator
MATDGQRDGRKATPRILIVDDQYLIVEVLRIWVETFGCEVCGVARSGEAAIDAAGRLGPDLVIMDMRLGGVMDGVAAARAIRARNPATRLVFCSGDAEAALAADISALAPACYVGKPVNPDDLRRAFDALLGPDL